MYMEPNAIPCEAKAIVRYDYNAQESTELTLRVGDIIRNIVKFDNGWWQGDLGQQQGGFFPSNFVEEWVGDDSEQVSTGARCVLPQLWVPLIEVYKMMLKNVFFRVKTTKKQIPLIWITNICRCLWDKKIRLKLAFSTSRPAVMRIKKIGLTKFAM